MLSQEPQLSHCGFDLTEGAELAVQEHDQVEDSAEFCERRPLRINLGVERKIALLLPDVGIDQPQVVPFWECRPLVCPERLILLVPRCE